jgi:hypothetical protein
MPLDDDLPIRRWAPMTVRLRPAQWRLIRSISDAECCSVQAVLVAAIAADVRRRGVVWPSHHWGFLG